MTEVNNTDIEKIAKLSRLSFNDKETAEFAQQISGIISWVDKLNEVDTDDVTPMMAVDDKLRMRQDVINVQNETSDILQNCDDKQFDFYAVPKFVE